jgi:uncharacterized protein (TIGR02300 family)
MPAKDLGIKHTCFKCGTKFYDMKKPEPICPKCGSDQRESPALKPASEGRKGRLSAPKVVEPVAEEPEAAAEEADVESFEEEEAEEEEAFTEEEEP